MKNNYTMIPSCFSNPSSPTFKSHQMTQNLITTIYQTQLCNNTPTYLTLTWSKTLQSHSLTINASNSFSITISLKHPSKISFFKSRPGSKYISLSCHHHHHHKIKLFWDFTRAKFSSNSAEPDSCFYIAISSNSYIEFLLGDLRDEAVRRAGAPQTRESALPSVLSRREHVFGRTTTYSTKAQFLGSNHEIGIDCSGGELKVKVDGEVGLVVKRLAWKFRGNERIMVGGSDVEFYWDVYNWIVGSKVGGGGGHGVFVFQVGEGGVWPEIAGLEKRLMRKTMLLSSACSPSSMGSSLSPSSSSVLQWAEESSDGGRSSCASSSTRSSRSYGSTGGFSLLLYAWKSD